MHTSNVLQKPVHLQIAHISSEMDKEPGPTSTVKESKRLSYVISPRDQAQGEEFGGFLRDDLRLRTWLWPWLCHELAVTSVSAAAAAAAASIYQVSTVYLGCTWELWKCQCPGRTPTN